VRRLAAGGLVAVVVIVVAASALSACSSGDDKGEANRSSSDTTDETDGVTTTTAEPDPTTAVQGTSAATASPDTAPAPTAAQPIEVTYTFPVDPSSVADYGQTHHDYPATDIFVPVGTHYVAVTDGVVDYISTEDTWDPGTDNPADRGGISVAFIGVDGVRYYGSHLSSVADGIVPGARVTKGQLLGLSGKTGNARGTSPHVHFGISRPTTPDDWQVRRGELEPYPLLNAWRAGLQTAPDLSSL
jgi:murein DD-endopeptidase MepM/ murein hydrolase activator NlpD